VELFLKKLASNDVQNGILNSAAVDVCVAFLLKNAKCAEAMEVQNNSNCYVLDFALYLVP
jgi:hypothetical protein